MEDISARRLTVHVRKHDVPGWSTHRGASRPREGVRLKIDRHREPGPRKAVSDQMQREWTDRARSRGRDVARLRRSAKDATSYQIQSLD